MTGAIDRDRMREFLGRLQTYRDNLAQLAQTPLDGFLIEPTQTGSAKYFIIAGVGAALDICNHIVSRHGRTPASYSECFHELARLGAISESTAENMAKATRLRNLLVHEYWDIDDRQVYASFTENLSDFDAFRQEVTAWLGSNRGAGI